MSLKSLAARIGCALTAASVTAYTLLGSVKICQLNTETLERDPCSLDSLLLGAGAIASMGFGYYLPCIFNKIKESAEKSIVFRPLKDKYIRYYLALALGGWVGSGVVALKYPMTKPAADPVPVIKDISDSVLSFIKQDSYRRYENKWYLFDAVLSGKTSVGYFEADYRNHVAVFHSQTAHDESFYKNNSLNTASRHFEDEVLIDYDQGKNNLFGLIKIHGPNAGKLCSGIDSHEALFTYAFLDFKSVIVSDGIKKVRKLIIKSNEPNQEGKPLFGTPLEDILVTYFEGSPFSNNFVPHDDHDFLTIEFARIAGGRLLFYKRDITGREWEISPQELEESDFSYLPRWTK